MNDSTERAKLIIRPDPVMNKRAPTTNWVRAAGFQCCHQSKLLG
jgi:hypothetical protein